MLRKAIITVSLVCAPPAALNSQWFSWETDALVKVPDGEKTCGNPEKPAAFLAGSLISGRKNECCILFAGKQNRLEKLLSGNGFVKLHKGIIPSLARAARDILAGIKTLQFPPPKRITLSGKEADMVYAKTIAGKRTEIHIWRLPFRTSGHKPFWALLASPPGENPFSPEKTKLRARKIHVGKRIFPFLEYQQSATGIKGYE